MTPRTDLAGIRQCDLLFREVRTSDSAVIVGAVPFAGGMPTTCRFPPPWTANGMDTCFIVRDRNGQALAYVYFRMARAANGGEVADPRSSTARCRQHRQIA